MGGDDLPLTFAMGALLRAVGLGILVAFAISFASDVSCPSVSCPWLLLRLPGMSCVSGYLALSVFLKTATALLEAAIAMAASKGTIMNDSPRHALPPLLLLHMLVTVWEIMLTVWAAISFWTDKLVCKGMSEHEETEATKVLRAVVWLQLISWSAMLLGFALAFDLSGSVDVSDMTRFNRRWEKRCKMLLCLSCREQDSSTEIALRSLVSSIVSIFAGLDLVPTDALAAMLLLALLPPSSHTHNDAETTTEGDASQENATHKEHTQEVHRRLTRACAFAPYASASYGYADVC